MTDLNKLQKEVRFRGQRRGMKELDITLGKFVDAHVEVMQEAELTQLRDILLIPEQDLWCWLTEGNAPTKFQNEVFHKLKQSLESNSND